MSNFTRRIMVACMFLGLNGCASWHHSTANNNVTPAPTTKYFPHPAVINCQALKRQMIYNQMNLNTETNDTTPAQKRALEELINQHCS